MNNRFVDSTQVVNNKINSTDLKDLLEVERISRNNNDFKNNQRVLLRITELLISTNINELVEQIKSLSSKHGHLKQAIAVFIENVYAFVSSPQTTLSIEQKVQLLHSLREVSNGKIYLELIRAKSTKMLSDIYESKGMNVEAVKVLNELQIETFGSMEKREKVEFLLKQMQLNLIVKDYDTCLVVSRKIHTKHLSDFEDLFVSYYLLLVELFVIRKEYLKVSEFYYKLYTNKSTKEYLNMSIVFAVLSKHSLEQYNQLLLLGSHETEVLFQQFLLCFTTNELLNFKQLSSIYASVQALAIIDKYNLWSVLYARVVEHNLITISRYYTKITITRLSQLLDCSNDVVEEYISNLVSEKILFAKINRPKNLVLFTPPVQSPLEGFSENINQLLQILSKTIHLINKEEMIHALG